MGNVAAVGNVVSNVGNVVGNVSNVGNVVGNVGTVVGNVVGNVTATNDTALKQQPSPTTPRLSPQVRICGGNVVGSVGNIVGNVGTVVGNVVGNVITTSDTAIKEQPTLATPLLSPQVCVKLIILIHA